MKVYEIAIRRPVTTLMFISSLLLLGYISWLHLPVQLLPDLTFPAMGIYARYSPGAGEATPDEMEEKITIPIENIVASLPRVKKIESHTGEGYCWLWVEMEYGADMRFLAVEVQERLEPLKKDFPRGTVFFGVEQINTAEFQKVLMHLVMKGPGEGEEVRAVVVDRIQQRLEDLPGISGVRIGGYSPERVRVRFDEQRLKEHRLPFQSVVQRVEGWSSPDVYLGEYKTRDRIYYVRIAGRYENLLDIQEVPLQEGKGLYLRDVAEVTQKSSREDREWLYRYEGREAIGIQLEKEALANPIVVSRAVRAELEKIRKDLPEGYEIEIRWDDAEFIEKVIKGVTKLALVGAGIAMIVLLLFLRNLRAALIVMLSIPVSIVATFNLMYFAGFSFNLFSLVGLAFGIGMLVDNSIVVLENIVRHYHLTRDRKLAALRGVQEVSKPILASTLTTVIVFVPVLFISEEVRLIFKEMSLSIVFPIMMSLVVAYTFVPMATSALLGIRPGSGRWKRWFRFLQWIPFYRIVNLIPRGYRLSIKGMLRHPMQMILIIVFLTLYAWGNRHRIDEGYLNRDINDESFTLYVTLPTGTKTETTSRVSQQVEEMLNDYPEIERFGAWIQNESSNIWIRLKEKKDRKRSAEEILDDMLDRTAEIPEANVTRYPPQRETPQEIEIPYGAGGSVEIRGPEQKQLNLLAAMLIDRLMTIPGIRSAESDIGYGQSELRLMIDREKAQLFQVSSMQIAQAVQSMRKGGQLAQVKMTQGEEEISILFELEAEQTRILDDLGKAPVYTGSGQVVPLSEICRFELGKTPGWIRRENQERMTQVMYFLAAGQDLDQVREVVKKHIEAMRIPPGYTVKAEAEREDIDQLYSDLRRIILIGSILIFMVLASLFESLGSPFVVLISLPLAIIGVVYGLILMKNPFDVFGVMGVIVLVGIVVNNAILLLHFVTLKRREGWNRSRAIIVSCLTRFRPIWMTTLTTTVGLIPLAMQTSDKSIWTPFAVVVIGGLFGSTILTPYVIPSMYIVLENQFLKLKRRFFRVLSWRWIFYFWNSQIRAERRFQLRSHFRDRFGRLGLSASDLREMPLEIEAKNLTMVYPEKHRDSHGAFWSLLGRIKREILLPSPSVGIVPAGGYWLRDITDTQTDPRAGQFGFKALDGIDFRVGKGMFGLLGPNGAGKTTLIRILATALPPSRGQLNVGGYDLQKHRLDIARTIGYLPQTFGFYERFTPMQYLRQMAIMKGLRRRKERQAAIERVLHQVNLWQERHRQIGTFSGGMRQRLGIAQTLLALPRIILVDEPTAGLDPKERVHFRNLLAEISQDRIVVLSTHIVEDISSSCDRVGIMDKGKMVFLGSIEELTQMPRGKVWELVCTPEEAERLCGNFAVISQTVVSEGKRLRLFSDASPSAEARLVEPSLEDAYIYVRRIKATPMQPN